MHKKPCTMFNEGGEIRLFARLNFNAVFYGDVLAGDRMPNLMYMLFGEKYEFILVVGVIHSVLSVPR